jgi:hypothetical protein
MSQILFVAVHELNESVGGINVLGLGDGVAHLVADERVEPFAEHGQRAPNSCRSRIVGLALRKVIAAMEKASSTLMRVMCR